MEGTWYTAVRGTNSKPWDRWQWRDLEDGVTLEVLHDLKRWADMGQHVRLEFIPDGVGSPDCDY